VDASPGVRVDPGDARPESVLGRYGQIGGSWTRRWSRTNPAPQVGHVRTACGSSSPFSSACSTSMAWPHAGQRMVVSDMRTCLRLGPSAKRSDANACPARVTAILAAHRGRPNRMRRLRSFTARRDRRGLARRGGACLGALAHALSWPLWCFVRRLRGPKSRFPSTLTHLGAPTGRMGSHASKRNGASRERRSRLRGATTSQGGLRSERSRLIAALDRWCQSRASSAEGLRVRRAWRLRSKEIDSLSQQGATGLVPVLGQRLRRRGLADQLDEPGSSDATPYPWTSRPRSASRSRARGPASRSRHSGRLEAVVARSSPSRGPPLSPSNPSLVGRCACREWLRLQAFCKHRPSAAMPLCFASCDPLKSDLAWQLHYGGTRRHA
jgi:hypothetical protein